MCVLKEASNPQTVDIAKAIRRCDDHIAQAINAETIGDIPVNPENETRDGYRGAYSQNICMKPGCDAQPGQWCIWTGEPNDRFPEPEGSNRAPHASRKYHD